MSSSMRSATSTPGCVEVAVPATEAFIGFPPSLYEFYDGLDEDNSKEFFHAHKEQWESSVKGPMALMLGALAPEFGVAHAFRPNRDVRFAKDKRPYKDNHGAVVGGPMGTGINYVEVNGAGMFVGSGMYQMAPDQLARFRLAVADDERGAALQTLVAKAVRKGLSPGGPSLVRVPKPWSTDHPREALFRHKRMILGRSWPQPAWLHTGEALIQVRNVWRACAPLNTWLAQFVGPSELPSSRR